MSGKRAIRSVIKVVVPDGKNGKDITGAATITTAYDYQKDIPFVNIAASNIGLVKITPELTNADLNGSKNFLVLFHL